MTTIIVGGGLAGLAAALQLSSSGVPCEVWESRGRFGGRASSFLDQKTGYDIDNCQHVAMGCCTAFQDFTRRTGVSQYFQRAPALYFVAPPKESTRNSSVTQTPAPRIHEFVADWLPAPLHLFRAFLKLSYLSLGEKWRLAMGLRSLAREPKTADGSENFAEWLKRHGQTPRIQELFWHVVTVSALSESLDRIDVGYARKVFVDGFLSHRDGWCVDIPLVPLDDLYAGPIAASLRDGGVKLCPRMALEKLGRLPSGEFHLTARDSSRTIERTVHQVILAVPWHRVTDLVSPEISVACNLESVEKFQSAPISSIHLWLDRPLTQRPHAVVVKGLSQWVFNRSVLEQSISPESRTFEFANSENAATQRDRDRHASALNSAYYYQVVISASRNLAGLSQADIAAQVLAELVAIWPESQGAQIVHSRQVTEHRAVFAPVPGIDALRISQRSPLAGLAFAGDWTKTGWPATMEGAVRSGYLAANSVLTDLGKPEWPSVPSLPVSWLSRLAFRIS